jgi:type II pantothenate kinase
MNSFGPVIGIDRGASFTDFGVVHNNTLSETRSLKGRDWESIADVYRQLKKNHKAAQSVFTGSRAGMPDRLAKAVQIIPEIDAIGFGGATLAARDDCIVASIGTGAAIVHFKDKHATHVGGTGVGGGTIKGLGSLLCNTEDPVEIEKLALKGNAGRMNLTISDLGYEAVSFLGADVTASNFAAVDSRRKEDLAAGILSLVGETVGILTSVCAREAGCPQAIVLVGKVAANRYIRNTVNLVAKLYQTTYIFPENPGYATVYGAALQFRHHRAQVAT